MTKSIMTNYLVGAVDVMLNKVWSLSITKRDKHVNKLQCDICAE